MDGRDLDGAWVYAHVPHHSLTVRRKIRHVDAFTSTPLEGNPAAVVDGEGIDDVTMQRIALNQHLSETVYLLPPERATTMPARIFR